MTLYAEATGRGSALVLLHGFTGNTGTWEALRERLARRWRVIVVDLPGHGRSPRPGGGLPALANDLAGVLDRFGVARAHWLGYSLGGRAALHVALAHPARVDRLVLESTSAGIADPDARHARRTADAALAETLLRDGVRAFAARWIRQPLFATQSTLPPDVRQREHDVRCANRADGLAAALRAFGPGAHTPLWDRLAAIDAPVLLLAGAHDDAYRAHAEHMAARLPRARLTVVPAAGHAVHLEHPDAFAAAVEAFLLDAAPSQETRPMSITWTPIRTYDDIRYEHADGIAKITINRPEVRNAFRPRTLAELQDAFAAARDDARIGVVILTGEGPDAFCSGGDQRVRGHAGYVDDAGVPRLNVLDLQRQIRTLPKPVVAMVAGFAIGGGHVLHVVCDLTIAADNAVFGQTGPRVGSFDGGYGATYLARIIGHKRAREIWYLCRRYDAQEALAMGLVNRVVPLARLEEETVAWCRDILANSPLAIRCLKSAFNADTDGLAGLQELAGNATLLYYMSEEAQEGRNAFLEKRPPDFARFPRLP